MARAAARVIVELHGLEIFGRHGVLVEEQRDGQTFLYDVALDVFEPVADTIDAAVDYRQVAATVEEVSGAGRFDLLESLAAAVAEALIERFPASEARVRVRKPRPVGIAAEWSAATAVRRRAG